MRRMRPLLGISRSIRQHVNPLATFFHQPPELPAWNAVWPQPTNPLHLDIGCVRTQRQNSQPCLLMRVSCIFVCVEAPCVVRSAVPR